MLQKLSDLVICGMALEGYFLQLLQPLSAERKAFFNSGIVETASREFSKDYLDDPSMRACSTIKVGIALLSMNFTGHIFDVLLYHAWPPISLKINDRAKNHALYVQHCV